MTFESTGFWCQNSGPKAKIRCQNLGSKEWGESIGMANAVHKNGDNGSWIGKMDMITEKFIKEINGNTITFDSTFYVPYDTTLTECFINKIDESERIENAGVENLRILSNHNGDPFDENNVNGFGRLNGQIGNLVSKSINKGIDLFFDLMKKLVS